MTIEFAKTFAQAHVFELTMSACIALFGIMMLLRMYFWSRGYRTKKPMTARRAKLICIGVMAFAVMVGIVCLYGMHQAQNIMTAALYLTAAMTTLAGLSMTVDVVERMYNRSTMGTGGLSEPVQQ